MTAQHRAWHMAELIKITLLLVYQGCGMKHAFDKV